MRIIFLFVSILFSLAVYSQTSVTGTITSNATWTLANSPYTLTGTLGIPSGVTLSIEAGVQVNGSFDLLVKGKIAILGSQDNRVRFQGTRLIFKSTNLSESIVQFIDFENSGVQLADESEFNQDSPKNSGTLLVSDCGFSSGGYARTKGYQTSAKLRLVKCNFDNSTIKGFYPRSELIELDEVNVTSSTINSDAYNYGIIITNSSIGSTSFQIGCCSANVQITNSTITSCSFLEGLGSPVEGLLKLHKVTMTNSYVNLPAARMSIFDSRISANNISSPTLVRIGNGEVRESVIEGYSGLTLFSISGLYGYNVGNPVVFDKVSFKNFSTALSITNFQSIQISSSNFLNGQNFNIRNLSNKNINAQNNYWGTSDETVIKAKIFDLYDDINYGIVDYSNYAVAPIVINSMPAPAESFKGIHQNGILMAWKKVESPRLKGYKIYKRTTNNTYELVSDAGNAESKVIAGDYNATYVVTSYDDNADGIDDLLEGYESQYSPEAKPFLNVTDGTTNSFCEGSQVNVDFLKNYSFSTTEKFDLMISFQGPNVSGSIASQQVEFLNPSTLKITFPDTISIERTAYLSIRASQSGVYSEFKEFKIKPKPSVDFDYKSLDCPQGIYELQFKGTPSQTLVLTWNTDGGIVTQNNSSVTLQVGWQNPGQKNVTLTGVQNGCSASVSKLLNIVTPPPLAVPSICSINYMEDERKLQIKWSSADSRIKTIKIYREGNTSNLFEVINSVDAGTSGFIDQNSNPVAQSHRYKVSGVDACGKETDLSLPVKSIHLQVNKGLNNSWNLVWEIRPEDNKRLDILKRFDTSFILISSVPNSVTLFTDVNDPFQGFCYQVALSINGSCSISSNIVCNSVTSIQELVSESNIFPNPFKDSFQIESPVEATFEIVNNIGVVQKSGGLSIGTNQIDLNDYPDGLYYLKIMGPAHTKIIRVSKN